MKARDLMTKEIEVCVLDDSAAQAGQIMERRNCGFIPVVRHRTDWVLEGVLTDRDMALFLAKTNRRAEEIRVEEFCTRNPKTILENTEIPEVEAVMKDFHIHRIPVVDDERKLVGIISLKDLAKEAWEERLDDFPELREKEIAEIVESISLAR